jgi:hypothetical protein
MESLKYKITNPHLKSKTRKNPTDKDKLDDPKQNTEIKVIS